MTEQPSTVTIRTAIPSVFDAGLPTLDYDLTTTPAQLYPRLVAAQQQAPIALGPFGPKFFRTSSCAPSLATVDSRYHPASISPPKASPPDPCGTRSSTRCSAWKAPSTSASAASSRRRSHPELSSAYTPPSSTSSTKSSNRSAARATVTSSPTSRAPTPSPSSAP